MAGEKGILVIVNLDTRGPELNFVKDLIAGEGYKVIVMDFSMELEPPFPGDITCEEIASAGGMTIEEVRFNYNKADRAKATNNQIAGARKIAVRLFNEGKIHGAIGVGGGTTTLVATSIMKAFPFGFPKLIASPMAAHPKYIEKYVGTKDITMHHTVLDIVGLNPLLKMQLQNAVGAICGMVGITKKWEANQKPFVAVTGFGHAERTVEHTTKFLEMKGYQPIVCHAQGVGDKAMDEMIADGLFQGVIDLVTGGISDELFNGNCAGGANRVLAACRANIPQVVCPGGLEKISYGGRSDLHMRFGGRPMKFIDSTRVLVKTSKEETLQIARVLVDRLNQAVAPVKFLYPNKGWSSLSEAGQPLHSLETNQILLQEIEKNLNEDIEIVKVPLVLNSEDFARTAVDLFDQIYREWTAKK